MRKQIFRADRTLVDGAFADDIDVHVEGGVIRRVSPRERGEPEAPVVELRRRALVPGTVNAHTHAFQSLLRGYADDRPFLEWRDDALYRLGGKLDVDGIYLGSLFAFAEMLRHGVTTVTEFFYLHGAGLDADRAVRRAARDAGIRLVMARTFYDGETAPAGFRESVTDASERCATLMSETRDDPFCMVVPAPHSVHAASGEMIVAAHALAREHAVPFHIHVSEQPFEVEECVRKHGLPPLLYLDALGVVDSSMVLVHGCHLEEREKDLMAERGVRLAHCPGANLFLADGVCDLVGLRQRGVRVGLGTDGGCANSRVGVFDDIRLSALLQKGTRQDATAIDAGTALAMGTHEAGDVLGLPVGRIAEEQHADLVAIDLDDPSVQPEWNLEKNIVYSMSHLAVAEVFVAGEQVADRGRTLKVPLDEISRRVAELTRDWSSRWTPRRR